MFKLIIATAYFAASLYPSERQMPLSLSFQGFLTFKTEQECMAQAFEHNKSFKETGSSADQELKKLRDGPLDAVLAKKNTKNMDRLSSADWDEIRSKRKAILEAQPPIPVSMAVCVQENLLGR